MGCKVGRFALNHHGMLIGAADAYKAASALYWCPHCARSVIVKYNIYGTAFFAHHKRINAQSAPDFSTHQMLQKMLKQIFSALGIFCELEYRICDGQRADVFLCLGEQPNFIYYVIEVQRSPITCTEITKRITAYEHCGIGIIWLIPKFLHMFIHLHQWERYLVGHTSLLLYYDSKKKGYYYVSDYLRCAVNKMRIVYQKYDISNIQFSKRKAQYLPCVDHTQRITPAIFKKELFAWRRKRQYKRTNDLLQRFLYQSQLQVDEIPLDAYTLDCRFLNSNQSFFFMQTFIYLLLIKQRWTVKHIIAFCLSKGLFANEKETQDITSYVNYMRKKQAYSLR